jgi:hypothetical protein
MEGFKEALQVFVAGCQEKVRKNYEGHSLGVPVLEVRQGPKYAKLVSTGPNGGSVYCFVNKENGDVLKSASFSAPAKGVRGNIYAADNGLSRMGPYGAGYNK